MSDGFSNILGRVNPVGGNRKSTAGSPIFTARVNNIILCSEDEGYNENGQDASIGFIFFSNPTSNSPSQKNLARPLFPFQKYYPLINELVYLIGLPSTDINDKPAALTYYYFAPINIWGSNHHNAIPDEIFTNQSPDYQKQDYVTVGSGVARHVTDGSTEIDLGYTFQERLDLRTLQPYEGDYILEGRWGNSIRFGSTVLNGVPSNTWSDSGINGDPITIIRNGQYKQEGVDPWVPIVEDINQDSGSIYLTSTQKISITPPTVSYNSYSTQPTAINEYVEPQVIINSGRLVFNSFQDHVLLSSKKSVGLNAVESVNIDTPKTVIQSKEVYLGGKEAIEPVLKGDATIAELSDLVQELISLGLAMKLVVHPAFAPVTTVLNDYLFKLNQINANLLTKTKSTYSKTL
jgi:hypothetical protein